MSHGPSDKRVPDADWATQEIKDIILDAWRPDWTRPGHEKYEGKPEFAKKVANTLRDMESPQIDQALAALEDAGYEIIRKGGQ
jgi:hypothetical protein